MVVQFVCYLSLYTAVNADLALGETKSVKIRFHVGVFVQQVFQRSVLALAVHTHIEVQHSADETHLQFRHRINRTLRLVVLVENRNPDTCQQMVFPNTEPHGGFDLEHKTVGGATFQQAAIGTHRNAVAPYIIEIIEPKIHLIVLEARDFQEFGIIPQHGAHSNSMLHVFPIGMYKIVVESHVFLQTLLLFREIGAQTDLRTHMVEIVTNAVAV